MAPKVIFKENLTRQEQEGYVDRVRTVNELIMVVKHLGRIREQNGILGQPDEQVVRIAALAHIYTGRLLAYELEDGASEQLLQKREKTHQTVRAYAARLNSGRDIFGEVTCECGIRKKLMDVIREDGGSRQPIVVR